MTSKNAQDIRVALDKYESLRKTISEIMRETIWSCLVWWKRSRRADSLIIVEEGEE